MQVGVPQGSVILLALINHFVSYCPITDLDMTSYTNDFASLASAPSIVDNAINLNLGEVGRPEATGHCSPEIQRDTLVIHHQSWLHLQVRIGDKVVPLTRTPKILGVIHFT